MLFDLHSTNQEISEPNTKKCMPNDINWNDIDFSSPVQMFFITKAPDICCIINIYTH